MAQAQGIDVSRYQTEVDWVRVRNAGVSFAIAKSSEGLTLVDAYFARNWERMKQAGVVRGAYHFFRASRDPRAQAELMARTIPLAPGDLPPVLDVEVLDGLTDKGTLTQTTYTCLTEIERLMGVRPIIYTSPNFWNTNFGLQDWTKRYPLWIAHYTTAASPIIPKGWTEYRFWQFTDRGTVDGIANTVDRNVWNGTEQDMRQWVANATGAWVPPGTEPMPVPDTNAASSAAIQAYFQALNSGNPDAVVALYHPNGAHVTGAGIVVGAQNIRAWYADLLSSKLPNAVFQVGPITAAGTSKTFDWTATSPVGQVKDGQDTLGFLDGKIAYHASSFTIQ